MEVHTKFMVYYRLTPKDISGQILEPKIPFNFMTSIGAEDNSTPRICVCPSIESCLLAVPLKHPGMEYYVNTIDIDESSVMIPDVAQVPDQKITDETWIIEPIAMQCVGQIKLIEPTSDTPYRYEYYDPIVGSICVGYLYPWSYIWLEGGISEQDPN